MRSLLQNLTLAACCLLLTACDGPLIFMSGGELKGNISDVPKTWQLEQDSAVAQLETRPDDPYSINLSYVQLDGVLYVYAGDTKTNWVQNIEQNPLVRIRIDNVIYPARAVRVTSAEELTKFANVWANLSMFQRDPLDFEEVWLYRLVAR